MSLLMINWLSRHQMLNCILSMVEKTRKALGILQQRTVSSSSNHQRESAAHWKRRSNQQQQQQQQHHHQLAFEASELRRQASDLVAQTLKATDERVSQVKRQAGIFNYQIFKLLYYYIILSSNY